MGNVKIRLFGKFEILSDGSLVLEQLQQARKTNLFVKYLLLRKGEPVSHEELLSALWSDRESGNPATALRTMLHRYRALIEDSGIPELMHSVLTTRGYYQWNTALDCEVDIYALERLCREAADERLDSKARIDRCMRALDLYAGPLLAGSEEPWIVQKSVYYHDMYKRCVLTLIELLKRDEAYDTVVQVCRRAQEMEPFDERLHLELVLALSKTGRKNEALNQYYFLNDVALSELSGQASEEMRVVYRRLVEADSATDADINGIRAALEEEDGENGALICEYSIFADIYRIQRRMLERSGGTIFLGLCTVTSTNGESPDPLVQEHAMRDLLGVLRINLRRSDTICRFSASQYALLLPMVTYDAGKTVMERVRLAFYQAHSKAFLAVSYKIRPLGTEPTAVRRGKRPKN